MNKIRECIHRLRCNQTLRQLQRELGVHRSVVRNIRNVANQQSWLDPALAMPDDAQIEKAFSSSFRAKSSIFEPYHDLIREWRNSGYSTVAIHKLLLERQKCSLSQLRRYLKQHFQKQVEPIMVRQTSPGEIMDVDFTYVGLFWDHSRACIRKTWLFSGRLRHSRKAYREVVFDQSVSTFIRCHIHAFEWFGGVPYKVVLDNLKAGVTKSCVDNDQLNRAYMEMAEHYKVILDPCRPYTPEHKGGVESDMRYIKGSFFPIIKEKQKHQPKIGLEMLQEELVKWDREVADQRIIHGVGRSPAVIFEEEEKSSLKPLPETRWQIAEWHQCEVRKDWRIMYASAYYSVPYSLIGKTVQIMVTDSHVRVFWQNNPVAMHQRAKNKWEYLRNADHAPPFKEAILTCSKEGLLEQSSEIGPHTKELAQKIFDDPVTDKLRPVRRLLALVVKYGKERLESACKRALHYKTHRYHSVKNILLNCLDQEPITTSDQTLAAKEESRPHQPSFRYARDPIEYKSA